MDFRERYRIGERLRQARRQAIWDATHLRTVSTKLTVAKAKELHAACEKEGVPAYTLLRLLLQDWLDEWRDAQETGATSSHIYVFFRGRAETLAEPDAAERVMV